MKMMKMKMKMKMKVPVMAASWLMLMSSSPSEMCLNAPSVPAVTTLLLLEEVELLEELDSEEVEGDVGPGGGGHGEGAGGGRGEERGGSSCATDITLQEETHV